MDRNDVIFGVSILFMIAIVIFTLFPLQSFPNGTITGIYNTYTSDGSTYTNYTVTYNDHTLSFISPCSLYYVGGTVPLAETHPMSFLYYYLYVNTYVIPKGC